MTCEEDTFSSSREVSTKCDLTATIDAPRLEVERKLIAAGGWITKRGYYGRENVAGRLRHGVA